MNNESAAAREAQRAAFYDRISALDMTPLWSVMSALITPTPASACRAHCWHYAEIRPYLLEAGELISAREAERRVLILENPGLRGQSRITTSLYAGLQLVLPGEVAPAHRHSQSALRFVIDGAGAYTSVDGERTIMQVGDFVITPSQTWHDHGNESAEPMIWLDGLDIPIVQFFDASFVERFEADQQPISRPTGDNLARYGANMLPLDYDDTRPVSPIFNYPYERSREALTQMSRRDEWDPCHGLKLRYVNPKSGGFAMPTIAPFLQLLPRGFSTQPYRSTDATIFTPVEGHGSSLIGGQRFDWGPKDLFVVPSWQTVTHQADSEAVLFSFSDRGIQQTLGLWREQRMAN